MPSFFVPLGALNAATTAVASVGNNLANLNTTGYKATTVSFRDMVSKQLGTTGSTPSQLGMGVAPALVTHQFGQGGIAQTAGLFDGAIQGNGFYVVRNAQGNQAYTRAGNFTVSPAGVLTTATGEPVQGWMASNGVVTPSGALSNITIPANSLKTPLPTTQFRILANLNAGAAVDTTFSSPVEVVDSLGARHTLTITYTKTDANAWSYEVTIPGSDVSGGDAEEPQSLATGNLTFDSNGRLTAPTAENGAVEIELPELANGAAAQTVTWNLYVDGNTPAVTQYAEASAISATKQDGSSAAQPVSVRLGTNGVIVAQYSNGKTVPVAQIALATILNPDSMEAAGNNLFLLGSESAPPAIGAPGTGGRGLIIEGALEGSTVDIATEFTNLMQFQRSYQASSKVITTMDEMTQDVISIKR